MFREQMRNLEEIQYEEVEVDEEEFSELEEFYVPRSPIVFDENGKYKIYSSTEDLDKTRKLFGGASLLAMIPIYCLGRAFQRWSWWRILLWSIPSAFSFNMLRNSYIMTSRVVTNMYLKEDGETVMIETIVSRATFRKFVIKIKDL